MSLKKKVDQFAGRMKREYGKYGLPVDDIFVRPSEWGGKAYEVVWESGPYEWAIDFTSRGTIGEEEFADDFAAFGVQFNGIPAVKVPDGLFMEPGYSYTLVCYKED